MKGTRWKLPARIAHEAQNEEWFTTSNGEQRGRSVTLKLPYREPRFFTVLGARETGHVWATEEGTDPVNATVLFHPDDFKGRLIRA